MAERPNGRVGQRQGPTPHRFDTEMFDDQNQSRSTATRPLPLLDLQAHAHMFGSGWHWPVEVDGPTVTRRTDRHSPTVAAKNDHGSRRDEQRRRIHSRFADEPRVHHRYVLLRPVSQRRVNDQIAPT